MKRKFLLIPIFALFLSACGLLAPSPTNTLQSPLPTMTSTLAPSATPTLIPTEEIITSGDPVWDRVEVENLIIFGTSADYAPFEYYDANYEIIGFDAALARNLGEKLGVEVQIRDYAFEGLPAALQSGQIDAAIAAISVTPERQALMDFTNVYYSGQDAILARKGSAIQPIVTPAQLTQYRVAAQRGSIYATWLQKTLVDTGLMPANQLLVYLKAEDAIRDLRENRNDLVIMDKLAADEYLRSGNVAVVGENLNRQLFAIALPKGASVLQAKLNEALIALQNDGTIARLIDAYLNVPVPIVTPTPQPTATAIPGPTATPSICYDNMSFERDVEIPDGTEIAAGTDFDKVWRIKNTGTCTWNLNYRIVFVQGDQMEGSTERIKESVRPGQSYDIIIDQKAPNSPGKYTSVWQMVNASGTPFGERVWVKITVPGQVQPTPVPPTLTPVPQNTPTSAPKPEIQFLNVSDPTLLQGDLLIVSWSFSGQSIIKAELSRTNPNGSITLLNSGMDVANQGQYEDLMMNAGTYTYTLKVTSEFGGTTVKTAVVNVTPAIPINSLQNIEWVLINLINSLRPDEEIEPLAGTELTLEFFFDNAVSGFAGCNQFNTSYSMYASNGLEFSDQILTGQIFCSDPVMGQEELYLDLLTAVVEYEIQDDKLILRAEHPDPNVDQMIDVLVFEAKSD